MTTLAALKPDILSFAFPFSHKNLNFKMRLGNRTHLLNLLTLIRMYLNAASTCHFDAFGVQQFFRDA
jgi:hypothetical protein